VTPYQENVGITTDLKRRLYEHNAGKSYHTSKFRPWRLVTYVAFSDRPRPSLSSATSSPDRATPSPTSVCGRLPMHYPASLLPISVRRWTGTVPSE
jgi:Predicted endonuclease containing a URI domain